MKLIVDMNLSPRWVDLLEGEGMAYARVNGFIVLTHDLDFSAILAATQGEKPA